MLDREKYYVDSDSMLFDENKMATYITVYTNDVPKWYKIHHNNKGAYIKIDGQRYYVLVAN